MIMQVTKKFVGLGDSIVKGVLMTQEENGKVCYSLSDNNIVDRVGARMRVDVLNLGKMGCTVETGERILQRHVEKLSGTEYIMLCFGGNDSDYDWRAIANNPAAEHEPKTSLDSFERVYARVINMVKELGYRPLILTLPPMDAQKYFDFFSSTFSAEQKKNVLGWLKGSVKTILYGHDLYNEALKRISASTDTQLIDITTPLGDGKKYLCEDGIHPNLLGQDAIAKIVENAILQ
jgi:lysophospholipase L1-like esterase